MACSLNEKGNVLLYIDNSNIFINTQLFSATKKRLLRCVRDSTCRVDIGKLIKLAVGSERQLLHGKLYGSEPPALDSVWQRIREKKIEVYHSKRSTWNYKEKQTDTDLVAAAIEDIITLREEAGVDRTLILFTGDKDMLKVVQRSIVYKWKVEIWSYDKSLSTELKNEEKMSPDYVKIKRLDEHFTYISFCEPFWGRPIPKERTIVLRFKRPLHDIHNDMKKLSLRIIDVSTHIFKLPFKIRLLKESHDAIVIPVIGEKMKVKSNQSSSNMSQEYDQIYDFNQHIWSQINYFKQQIELKVDQLVEVVTYLIYEQRNKDLWVDFIYDDTDLESLGNDFEAFDIDASEAEFSLVEKKKSKKSQIYSSLCTHGFYCFKGTKCDSDHRPEEKEFFKEHPLAKYRYLYKSKICTFGDKCKYIQKKYLCQYAHDILEAKCIRCHKIGVHWSDSCDIKS